MDSFSFFVPGEPITEGSTKAFTSGQRVVVTHDRGPELDLWRLRVARAAEAAARKAGWEPRHDGPVAVTATFLLPRPKSAPKTRIRPHVKPDLDKLQRAVGDALSPYKRPGVLRDDSRIVEWHSSKQYACVPTMVGAIITISTVDEAGAVTIYADAERIAAEELAIQEEAS
jgi:crossover junction endodeoxyribonuclease RusA